jgi:hypothetical protein
MIPSTSWRARPSRAAPPATRPPGRSATFRLERGGRALICSTHGAVHEPISGRCTAGPCVGDHLTALPLALDGDTLVVRLPLAVRGRARRRPSRGWGPAGRGAPVGEG